MLLNKDIFIEANRLRMYGISANKEKIEKSKELLDTIPKLLAWEDLERQRRKKALLSKKSGVKNFYLMSEFDWSWPKQIDKEQVLELFSLNFIKEMQNIVLIGQIGVGKTMIAQNLVKTAADAGIHSVFVNCSSLIDDMQQMYKQVGLEKALAKYVKPKLLAIDEMGYIKLNTEQADLLFQLVHRRTEEKSTIVTTNITFAEWPSLFPNVSTVTALLDRLIERCEVIQIQAESYRKKKHEEATEANKKRRALSKKKA